MTDLRITKKDDKSFLFLNGKLKLVFSEIFEARFFNNEKSLAVLCQNQEGKTTKTFFVVLNLKTRQGLRMELNPKPIPGVAIHLLGKKEDRQMRLLYKGLEGNNYIVFSNRLEIRGPLSEEVVQIILEEYGGLS